METLIIFIALITATIVISAFVRSFKQDKIDNLRELEIIATQETQLLCPHCQTRGKTRTNQVLLKKGVSGGKLVAALLTGGISILFVGLSRKELQTKAICSNCGSVWHFS